MTDHPHCLELQMIIHRQLIRATAWYPPCLQVELRQRIIRIERVLFEQISPRELAELSNVLTACNIR